VAAKRRMRGNGDMTSRYGGQDRVSTKTKLAGEMRVLGEVLVEARECAGLKQSDVAEKLGLPPTRCAVIEDTYKGVLAAANAGMACIAVPNEYTLHNDFSRASLVLPNLGELTPEVIRSLLK